MVVVVGIAWIILVKRSTNTTIASYPSLVLGKLVIKSMLIDSQAPYGIGNGYSNPIGR